MTRAQQVILAFVSLSSTVTVAEPPARPPVQPVAKPTPPNAGAPAHTQMDMEVVARRRPPPQPPLPAKPPAEIATLGKQLVGTWQCKGNTQRGDGSSAPVTATVTVKLDLDEAWIQTTLVETGKPTGAMKFVEYRTYDATAKQWTRIQIVNTTGHVVSTSLGEKDGKWTWAGEATSPNGTLQLHDYEQLAPKDLKLWGEALLGGTWQKTYEVSCKK